MVMTALEVLGALSAAGMGSAVVVAQLTPADAPLVELLFKGGAVGIVAGLFWWFMRLHFKALKELSDANREAVKAVADGHKDAVDRIEAAHTHSADKFDQGAQRIVDAVSTNVRRCQETAAVLEKALKNEK